MNTNITKLNLEITGQVSHYGSTTHRCIFMCAGQRHNIVLTTSTIDYDIIKTVLKDDPDYEALWEFMDTDSSIEVADQNDTKAIAAVISNIEYLNRQLFELNSHQLAFAVSNAQEEILDESN